MKRFLSKVLKTQSGFFLMLIVKYKKGEELKRNCEEKKESRNPLEVQWLGLHTFTAKGLGSIPGWGTKILCAAVWSKNEKKREKGKLAEYTEMANANKI